MPERATECTLSAPSAFAGPRRPLIAEGEILLRYLTGQRPKTGMLKRYVRGVLAAQDFRALQFPAYVRRWPWTFRLIDPLPGRGRLLRKRVYLASLVADASSQGACVYYDYAGTARWVVVLKLVALGCIEMLVLLPRLLGLGGGVKVLKLR